MKILVCLKQVPDTETKIKVAADGKSLDPADVKWITSPYDEYALEEALRLKEAKGAEVTAATVGDDKAKDILRNAFALGADQEARTRDGGHMLPYYHDGPLVEHQVGGVPLGRPRTPG